MRGARYIIVALVLVLVGFIAWAFGPVDTIPRVRATGLCDGGRLRVNVYQQRLRVLPTSRVAIVVRITDASSNLLFERTVFEDGWWHQDIGDMYSKVQCAEDAVYVGPKFDPRDFYRISKTEFLSQR